MTMDIRAKIVRRELDKFLEKHASNAKILDIGSGNSSYNRFFPNRIALDLDPARKPDVIGDAHNLPFKDGKIEAILSTDVCEHLKDPVKAVSEMHRVLKQNGLVIFTTRFVFPIHDAPGDYWRFTKYGLRQLFRDFEILELEPETTNFSTLAVLLQRLGYQTRLRWNKPMKFFIFLLARILEKCNGLIKEEYGDIARTTKEEGMLASGYYLVARKK
jgi:ubiquinone/menaquinone biosynthesis C-methylase UbiE